MNYGIIYRLRKIIEVCYPFVLGGISAILTWHYASSWFTNQICTKLSSILLSILSIFLGFAFASIALLISMGENKFLKNARQTGAFQKLMSYHFKSLFWCFAGISIAIAYSLIDPCSYLTFWGPTLVGIGVGCIFCFLRLCHLLWLVLKYAGYI